MESTPKGQANTSKESKEMSKVIGYLIQDLRAEAEGLDRMRKGIGAASPKQAIIKFNGGRGALLCNYCHTILRQDFNPREIVDKQYFCKDFGRECSKPRWRERKG